MRLPHFIASALAAAGIALSAPAWAISVNLVGTFGTKALVSIDNGTPRKMAPGDKSAEGVLLVSVTSDSATFEIEGQRRTLKMGQHYAGSSTSTNASVVLAADPQGHFITQGSINGGAMTFMVDTGASMVAIPAAHAKRLNIKYRNAPSGMVSTANGMATAYKVTLDSVRIGSVSLSNVDAMILEGHMPFALLGMTFLNRMEMKRSGEHMTLTKRY